MSLRQLLFLLPVAAYLGVIYSRDTHTPTDMASVAPAAAPAAASAAAPSIAAGGDHSLTVQFCTSWSYRGAFQEFNAQLRERLPSPSFRGKPATLSISGDGYPVSPLISIISTVLSLLQVLGLVLTFAGDSVFRAVGVAPEAVPPLLRENRGTFILVIFVLNMVVGKMSASGAFEVAFDGEVVFSKLQTGRMPTVDELIRALAERGLTA